MSSTEQLDKLIARIDSMVYEVERLPTIPRRLRDELTASKAVVRIARAYIDRCADVQTGMFGDTPVEPALVPYSDTGHSLQAAAKFAKSGKGNQFELDVLELLNHRPRTCDDACAWFEKREYSRTGEHISMHATISPRFVGLKAKGHIFEDGKAKTRRDCDAGVYHISASGRERLAKERKPK